MPVAWKPFPGTARCSPDGQAGFPSDWGGAFGIVENEVKVVHRVNPAADVAGGERLAQGKMSIGLPPCWSMSNAPKASDRAAWFFGKVSTGACRWHRLA